MNVWLNSKRSGLLILVMVTWLGCNLTNGEGTIGPTLSTRNQCDQVWSAAKDDIHTACSDARGENEVCYGSYQVEAERTEDTGSFEEPGDIASLRGFRKINAVVDVNQSIYGMAVLDVRLHSPLPGVVIDDIVRFVLYGDVQIGPQENKITVSETGHTPENLGAFYFLTGVNSQPDACNDLLSGGLLIEAPDGLKVDLVINGASVTIGSTVLLEAVPNANMIISVLEGSAQVTYQGTVASATSMQAITVPLAPRASNGWSVANGTPLGQQPIPLNATKSQSICDLLRASNMLIPPSCPPRSGTSAIATARPLSATPFVSTTATVTDFPPPTPTVLVPPGTSTLSSPVQTLSMTPIQVTSTTPVSVEYFSSNVPQASPGYLVNLSWKANIIDYGEVFLESSGVEHLLTSATADTAGRSAVTVVLPTTQEQWEYINGLPYAHLLLRVYAFGSVQAEEHLYIELLQPTPTPTTSSPTPSPSCYKLPSPQIVLESMTPIGSPPVAVVWLINVINWNSYPAEMFSDVNYTLPYSNGYCDSNPSLRTIVLTHEGWRGANYCTSSTMDDPSDLQYLQTALDDLSKPPPDYFEVEMFDRYCNQTYLSNRIQLPMP